MNKEEYLKKLKKELKFLTKDELNKEINFYEKYFKSEETKNILFKETIESIGTPKDVAQKIYLKRGIETKKINENYIDKIIGYKNSFIKIFKNEKNDKTKLIVDLVIIVLIVLLLKTPFDLIKNIGYDYLFLDNPNATYEKIWETTFLILYIITMVCTLFLLVKNFIKKYN